MKRPKGSDQSLASIRRGLKIYFAICAALLLLDFFHIRHTEHPMEGIWGFYAVYGFVACVVLVLVAKEMRKLVMRPEDYYEKQPTTRHTEKRFEKEGPHEHR